MSLGIQKYTDFDRFVCGMDFEKLFSWKYKYFKHLTISLKPSRLFFSSKDYVLQAELEFTFFFFYSTF
jgi:hypothetical protein